jgi:CheY-like chemotaxis protein
MGRRVLIVDDSPISLEMVRRGLAAAGFEPVGAADLAGVTAALASGPFDAVVVDLHMPEAFGDDLLEFLREGRKITAPIVLYSEQDERMLAERAAAVRADGYVPKSAGIERLLALLNGLCKKAAPTPPKAAGRRVMVVDDSEMTARLIEAELAGTGFEIVLADSVDKATRLILKKATRPELILLDVNMPNVDGASFCRFIKGNSLFAGIKVVLCSGIEPAKLKALAEQCGADGFVAKDSFLSRWVLQQIEEAERARTAT